MEKVIKRVNCLGRKTRVSHIETWFCRPNAAAQGTAREILGYGDRPRSAALMHGIVIAQGSQLIHTPISATRLQLSSSCTTDERRSHRCPLPRAGEARNWPVVLLTSTTSRASNLGYRVGSPISPSQGINSQAFYESRRFDMSPRFKRLSQDNLMF